MEDGLNEANLDKFKRENTQNGVDTTVMANFPDGTVAIVTKDDKSNLMSEHLQLNGSVHSSDEADNDSETDALVIDESVSIKRRVKKRKRRSKSNSVKNSASVESDVILQHSNPYFNESLFELSQQHQLDTIKISDSSSIPLDSVNKHQKKVKSKNNSPRLQEYAQYLGLQPAVQFKCSKCHRAGFESLVHLNKHLLNCTEDANVFVNEAEDSSVSSFKLTRKVFLCSACGTYYENWNLYMHMLEYHRRYICLYCLGMFSVLDDLCQHIQNRHNCQPQQRETPEDFFKEYKEPCFLICCDCKKLFNEQDNFFYHKCENSGKIIKNKCVKQQIRPENHVTGDYNIEKHSGAVSNQVGISNNSEMVRSEINDNKEVLPQVPNFVQNTVEMNESFKTSENINMCTKNILELDQDLTNSNYMEMSNKQESVTLTTDSMNNLKEMHCPIIDINQDKHDAFLEEQNEEVKLDFPEIQFKIYKSNSKSNNEESSENFNRANGNDDENNFKEDRQEDELLMDTRKVPKLSLKLSNLSSFTNIEPEDTDESEKVEMEQIESENEYCYNNYSDEKIDFEEGPALPSIPVAGVEVNIIELELEQPLDKFDIKVLLQKCLSAVVPFCVYCNHARKIAVNGKQLGLHAIAEHRFSATVNSITAEELIPESFVERIKESLDELESVHFNLESSLTEEAVTFSHVFECFQCRYSTNVHKELYLHNRKMHTKNLLLCIMCKSNFYSYSELICHLCPGDYVLDHDVQFRCCMCVGDDLPSAFRLMVHLRKRHHVCDVCLEMCHNQYKLSNHVWKHKLHHFCYRCGIAYRNKQDITRHLFWKHGTESVLCKKCLQKKWPHVFHFCIPPAVFTCDECNLDFSKAVYLKVHKRMHTNDDPHFCSFENCAEKFISKKLLKKHEKRHLEPDIEEIEAENVEEQRLSENENNEKEENIKKSEENGEEKLKPKVDVYDLPELNLSESSDSELEIEAPIHEIKQKTEEEDIIETLEERTLEVEQELANNVVIKNDENYKEESLKQTEVAQVPILESIWDDFKIYQAKKEKIDNMFGETEREEIDSYKEVDEREDNDARQARSIETVLRDHDYFYNPEASQDSNVLTEVEPDLSQRVDHDYCTPKETTEQEKAANEDTTTKEPDKKPNAVGWNSDSDSSSCSCGSNCSCSSSSSSSSSSDSSDSDSSTEAGRRRQQVRRERKKKNKLEKKDDTPDQQQVPQVEVEKKIILEAPIVETDLSTTESETDEEFYDKQPQKLAKKLLEEKRSRILAEAGSIPNGGFFENSRNSTPSLPEEAKPKKKSKSKKRKKKKSERKESFSEYVKPLPESETVTTHPSFYQPLTPTVAPLTISLTKVSSSQSPAQVSPKIAQEQTQTKNHGDSNLRASKRRRVPNKFYGYSSDEDREKQLQQPPQKWRKVETPTQLLQPIQQKISTPQLPLLVPPITIKTTPTVEPITIRSTTKPGELRVHKKDPTVTPKVPPLQINASLLSRTRHMSNSDSNDEDSIGEDEENEEENETVRERQPAERRETVVVKPGEENKNVQLYCYCRCPYDEVSEMIGCDSHDCAIEWFHFECVGIMVPPKGQWFCPDCRKRKQQRREMLQV